MSNYGGCLRRDGGHVWNPHPLIRGGGFIFKVGGVG
jgi:hypothetical protein